MHHRFLWIFLCMGLAAPLCGQEKKLPPLPEGPLLKRAPDYSTWTVTFQGHPMEGNAPLKTGLTGESKDKEPATMVSTVTKTGSIILEEKIEENGQHHQIWHFSGLRITLVPGTSKPLICPDYGGRDIFSTDFDSSDFAGFYWLSPTTYAGIVKYEGKDCIVFKGSVSPLGERAQGDEQAYIIGARANGESPPDAVRVAAIAYIDLATRLPVFSQFGNEKRIYQYGTPPTAPQVLPEDLAKTVKEYTDHLKRLSAPPAAP